MRSGHPVYGKKNIYRCSLSTYNKNRRRSAAAEAAACWYVPRGRVPMAALDHVAEKLHREAYKYIDRVHVRQLYDIGVSRGGKYTDAHEDRAIHAVAAR